MQSVTIPPELNRVLYWMQLWGIAQVSPASPCMISNEQDTTEMRAARELIRRQKWLKPFISSFISRPQFSSCQVPRIHTYFPESLTARVNESVTH